MKTRYALLWTDNRGGAHVRVLAGSHDAADAGLELLRDKYEGGNGFLHARVVELPAADYSIDTLRDEVEGEA
jgi:hypothetical protein